MTVNVLWLLCEAYEVVWNFVIVPEQQRSQPHQNHAALHTGEDPSCFQFVSLFNLPL